MSSQMPVRQLGMSGICVSALGLGSWNTFGGIVSDSKTIYDIIYTAYANGIRFFDMADSYADGEAERAMGKVLHEFPRHDLILSSKTYFPLSNNQNGGGLSKNRIQRAVESSLKRIGSEYLDIYFCHRFDKNTPLEETIEAMNELMAEGKIRHWGTSQWTAAQIRMAHVIAKKNRLRPPVVEQPELNLLNRSRFEQDTQPEAKRNDMGLITYSPLASGLLTGKYDKGVPEDSRLAKIKQMQWDLSNVSNTGIMRQFQSIAEETAVTRSQLAIAWAMAQPGVSCVILGATSLEQLKENLDAVRIEMHENLCRKLDRLFRPSLMQVTKFRLRGFLDRLSFPG